MQHDGINGGQRVRKIQLTAQRVKHARRNRSTCIESRQVNTLSKWFCRKEIVLPVLHYATPLCIV